MHVCMYTLPYIISLYAVLIIGFHISTEESALGVRVDHQMRDTHIYTHTYTLIPSRDLFLSTSLGVPFPIVLKGTTAILHTT